MSNMSSIQINRVSGPWVGGFERHMKGIEEALLILLLGDALAVTVDEAMIGEGVCARAWRANYKDKHQQE